ncbi:hypothetical protein [Scytonema sp. UIC 10036]|uniref:hypothetical protein n=1 Tax=Scytonema sp. UIC 10036 TaxID=2304196 RepID=UPI00140FC3EF|nr:hypothetical protein [Scytonema sp. UIC 10036]
MSHASGKPSSFSSLCWRSMHHCSHGYTYLRDRFLVGSPAILQPAQIGAIELPMMLDWLNHKEG